MLPPYDVVDMGVGIIPLAPLIVLRSGDANVFMEVTAAHFQALFKIVQKQIGDPDTQRDIAAMPKRQGRHPKSDPHAPIDSPRGTRYFIENKGGWNRCLKADGVGSTSSARARRRLVRISRSSRADTTPIARAGNKRKAADKVLVGSDNESNSCHSHGASGSEDQ